MVQRCGLNAQSCTPKKIHRGPRRCVELALPRFLVFRCQPTSKIFYQVAVLWKYSTHSNLVPFLGATTCPFQLVSDWMSGGNLTEYTTNHPDVDRLGLVGFPSLFRSMKRLPSHQLSGVAEGLNYLHSCNVIHGDLRGVHGCSDSRFTLILTYHQSNILVEATGRARITDFGLVTVAKSPGFMQSTHQGHAIRWTAPEILNGRGPYSKEADVFSFAMVTIEVRCG